MANDLINTVENSMQSHNNGYTTDLRLLSITNCEIGPKVLL